MAIKFVDRVPTRPGRIKITPEDGSPVWYGVMERADEPAVEGTPINAANLNAMQQNQGLSSDLTVYVATSGSDRVGDGTSSAPYATISKALSVIPKQLNGYLATIYILAGTYNENVVIHGFNGTIALSGVVGESITITAMRVSDTESLRTQNIAVNVIGAIDGIGVGITNSMFFAGEVVNISGSYKSGLYVNRDSTVQMNRLNVSNTTETAVVSNGCSTVFVGVLGGTNNSGMGAYSLNMSLLGFTSNSMTATTKYAVANGGRIYSGAQTSIPNY